MENLKKKKYNMKITIFLTFCVLIFHTSLLAQTNTQATPTETEWQTFSKETYSFEYPSNWELDSTSLMNTSAILFSPIASEQDQFRENVNLIVQDLTGYNLDLDGYTELSEGQVESMIANSKMLQSERIKTETDEFHKVVYTGEQGIFKLTFVQYYWVKNDQAYVLTFTAETSQFDAYKEVGEQILNSFKILHTPKSPRKSPPKPNPIKKI